MPKPYLNDDKQDHVIYRGTNHGYNVVEIFNSR